MAIEDLARAVLAALSTNQTRVRTATGLSSLTLAGIGFLLLNTLRGDKLLYETTIFGLPSIYTLAATVFVSATFGAGLLLLAYLRGDYGQVSSTGSDRSPSTVEDLMALLQAAKAQGDKRTRSAETPTTDKHEGIPDEPQKADSPGPSHNLSVLAVSGNDRIALTFNYTRGRLREEIANLSRRSSLNLVIGVVVTVAATGLLVYLISTAHEINFKSPTEVLAFYIPRVTVVTLIEVFAYFFLKLYRQNLEEIKYYQNELTTVATQEVAWAAALVANSVESQAVVIGQLAKSDRNSLTTRLEDGSGAKNPELASLLEVLQTVSKLIVSSSKGKE